MVVEQFKLGLDFASKCRNKFSKTNVNKVCDYANNIINAILVGSFIIGLAVVYFRMGTNPFSWMGIFSAIAVFVIGASVISGAQKE